MRLATLAILAMVACITVILVKPGTAQDEIGEAETVVRTVRGIRDLEARQLAVQDNVYSQEVIETDADSATRIVFRDGTELVLGPTSRITIDRYIYDPDTGAGELAAEFASGVFEFASGEIESDNYDLRTPLGNLTVRGTKFRVLVPRQ